MCNNFCIRFILEQADRTIVNVIVIKQVGIFVVQFSYGPNLTSDDAPAIRLDFSDIHSQRRNKKPDRIGTGLGNIGINGGSHAFNALIVQIGKIS